MPDIVKDIIPCFRLLIATGVVLFHKPSQTSPNCPCPSLRTNFKLFLSISHWSFVEWDRSAVTGFSICKKKKGKLYEKWLANVDFHLGESLHTSLLHTYLRFIKIFMGGNTSRILSMWIHVTLKFITFGISSHYLAIFVLWDKHY